MNLPAISVITLEAIPIAVYMIEQAKEHVEGCGGETHLVTVGENGEVKSYSQAEVIQIAKDVNNTDSIARELVGLAMNKNLPLNSYKTLALKLSDDLHKLRVGDS